MATVKLSQTGKVGQSVQLKIWRSTQRLIITVLGIHAKDNRHYYFPFGPQVFTATGFAPTYETVARPGRYPLLLRSGNSLPTLAFTLPITGFDPHFSYRPDTQYSSEGYMSRIIAIANTTRPIQISYNYMTRGLWRLTDLSIDTVALTVTNKPAQANLTVTFTRMSNLSIPLGPTSGGHKKAPPKKSKKPGKHKKVYVYTVKRGDTLFSICLRHYHNGGKWRHVADYNHIKHPNKIRIGQKIKLP